MQKYSFLISSFILVTSPISYAASPTITTSTDGSTITYQGGTVNGAIVQDGSIKKLVVNGTEVVNGNTTLNKGAGISLGGVNGSDRYTNDYGNLELEVDKNTSITATADKNIAGIYVRTDTADSLAKVTSGATINMTTTSSFPEGIRVENGGGSAQLNLTQDSDITVTGQGASAVFVSAKQRATIVNQGDITLNGNYGAVISVNAGTASVTSTGTITTNGLTNIGIMVNAKDTDNTTDLSVIKASGSITIGKDTAGTIVNGSSGAKGISLSSSSANKQGGTVIYDDQQNSIRINTGSTSANTNSLSAGIYSTNTGGGGTNVQSTMKSIDVIGDNSAAIVTDVKGGDSGNIQVTTNGDINITGGNSYGIKSVNSNTNGATVISHTGNITMTGSTASGLS